MTTSLLRRNRGARTPVAQPRFQLPEGDWQGELYPRRIPPLPRSQQRMFQRFFLAVIRRSARENYDYNCFLVTARLGRIFPIHAMLVGQLLRGGAISPPDTERVIIRIAWRMGCQYGYAHHTRMALDHGISRREIESLTNDDDPEWSDRTRTLLMAADELFATKNLSAPTYQRLRRELDENQILEFSMLVGHYVMAAMMLDVAGCGVEPAFRPDAR
jgi:4-carboxymuconolactone decarboxylase